MPRVSKYGNKRHRGYASRREANRSAELHALEKVGVISDLIEQSRYELLPSQYDAEGKLLERSLTYVADFVYRDLATGKIVVEDAKGFKPYEYKIKKKLMLFRHNIQIQEV
jgi:hypothetical protein